MRFKTVCDTRQLRTVVAACGSQQRALGRLETSMRHDTVDGSNLDGARCATGLLLQAARGDGTVVARPADQWRLLQR